MTNLFYQKVLEKEKQVVCESLQLIIASSVCYMPKHKFLCLYYDF